MLKPVDIKERLDEKVIGQDKCKSDLAVSIYGHMKTFDDPSLDNSTTLLTGPTGSGKTLMVSSVAEIVDIPFISFDATTLTNNGYKGENLVNVMEKLYFVAEKNYKKKCEYEEVEELFTDKAKNKNRNKRNDDSDEDEIKKLVEHGVIFLDEFDKIAAKSTSNSSDATYSTNLQYEFLKLMEGTEIRLFKDLKNKEVTINTKNILFILGGAFSGIQKMKEAKKMKEVGKKERIIGFNTSGSSENDIKKLIKTKEEEDINTEDLINYGIIPELGGRISKIINFHPLNEEHLFRILTEPKKSIINQYQDYFKSDNIRIEFEKEALKEVARIAIKENIGARGLKNILEKSIAEIKFKAPSCSDLAKIIITKKGLTNYRNSIFLNNTGEKIDIDSVFEYSA